MQEPWEFMWENLPPGFRFHPTDHEFVQHYLMNYVSGIREDITVIPIVDDLFKRDPADLPRLFRESSIIRSRDPEWWFLSKLKYKSQKVDKFDRSTSTGSWKSTGRAKDIHAQRSDKKIAMMRNLVFCQNPRDEETNWVMHEYYLHDTSLRITLVEQRVYVLCHLVKRLYNYGETSANMEVDLHLEGTFHGFPEELIQAKMRSLNGELTSQTTNDAEYCPTSLSGPVRGFNQTEHVMSMSGREEDDDILNLLNYVVFSADEESLHSGELEVASVYEPMLEETPREAFIRQNRQGRSPKALEGYVFIDETREFVEDGDASSVTDSSKDARTNTAASSISYFRRTEARNADDDKRSSDHMRRAVIERWQRNQKEAKGNTTKAIVLQSADTELLLRSPAVEVRQTPRTRLQTLRSKQGDENKPAVSRADDGHRPPIDYLVNLGVGIALLVLMMLWLLKH